MTGGNDGGRLQSRKVLVSPTPAAKFLLQFIMAREAPKGYETVYGNHQDELPIPLTQMTFDQVVAAGPGWTRKFGSSACGGYQFMRDTLDKPKTISDLKGEYGLTGQELFDETLQDQLGYALLLRRGFARFVSGKLTVAAFGLALAQEWASFPVLVDCRGAHRQVKRGQSYYAGDGLNKALVKASDVETALNQVLAMVKAAPSEAAVVVKAATLAAPAGTPGLSKTEIEILQTRLAALGYPIGKVDGLWGLRTKGAITMFRGAAGMPEGGWDDAVKQRLYADDAPRFEIPVERATATEASLAPASGIIRKAQRVKLTTLVQGAAGAPAVALGVASQFADAKAKLQPLIDGFAMVPGWVWGGAAVLLAAFAYYESQKIADQRVEMHQNGETA